MSIVRTTNSIIGVSCTKWLNNFVIQVWYSTLVLIGVDYCIIIFHIIYNNIHVYFSDRNIY